jgi:hypothetical protein
MSILVTAGLGLAGGVIAAPSQAHVGGYATHGHGGCGACHGEHDKRYVPPAPAAPEESRGGLMNYSDAGELPRVPGRVPG